MCRCARAPTTRGDGGSIITYAHWTDLLTGDPRIRRPSGTIPMDIKMWLRSRASNRITRPSASARSTQVLPELAEGDLAKLDLHDPEAKF
jgi:hypothetical protein